jgi:hypothetical protein
MNFIWETFRLSEMIKQSLCSIITLQTLIFYNLKKPYLFMDLESQIFSLRNAIVSAKRKMEMTKL